MWCWELGWCTVGGMGSGVEWFGVSWVVCMVLNWAGLSSVGWSSEEI